MHTLIVAFDTHKLKKNSKLLEYFNFIYSERFKRIQSDSSFLPQNTWNMLIYIIDYIIWLYIILLEDLERQDCSKNKV